MDKKFTPSVTVNVNDKKIIIARVYDAKTLHAFFWRVTTYQNGWLTGILDFDSQRQAREFVYGLIGA